MTDSEGPPDAARLPASCSAEGHWNVLAALPVGYQVFAKRHRVSISVLLAATQRPAVGYFFYGFDIKLYFSVLLTQLIQQGKKYVRLSLLYSNYIHFFFHFSATK